MDLNLVVLAGRLAAVPELRVFDSGSKLVRYLVTVKSQKPRRRVDVVPITVWEPGEVDIDIAPGTPVWTAGTVQRRFWSASDGRRSRLEIIADEVCLRHSEVAGTI